MKFFSSQKGRSAIFSTVCLSALLFALLSVSCSALPFHTSVNSVYGSYLIGRHAQNQGDAAIAIDHFASVLQENRNNPELLYHLFLLNLLSGEFQEAHRLASSVSLREQDNDLFQVFLGLYDLSAGEHDLALSAITSSRNFQEIDWIAPIASAWILWEKGQHEEAVRQLRGYREEGTPRGFRDFHEALMVDLLGDAELAEDRYRLAIEKSDGRLVRFVEGYGNFLERQERQEDARHLYQEYVQLDGFGRDLQERRRLAMEKNEIPVPLVRDGLEGSAELFYGVFSLIAREPNNGTAIVWLRFALFLQPDFFEARLLLADQYRQLGFQQAALENYRAIPSESYHYVNAGIQISRVFEDMEKVDEALELLARLRKEVPDSRLVVLRVAEFLRIHERYSEAIAEYSILIDSLETPHQEDWTLFFGRAVAYERSGNWSQAEADLQVAMKLSVEHPLVLNYLGYSWVDQGVHLNLALAMLKKATQVRPRNGYIVDSLGWAYYKIGEFDKASNFLERAVELEPDDPIINDHFGDSLWRNGRKLEARFQWRRALLLGPEDDKIAVIEDKLLNGLTLADNN